MQVNLAVTSIVVFALSVIDFGQAAVQDDIANDISNAIQPRIYLCKEDKDCWEHMEGDATSFVDAVKDLVNVLRHGDQMKCHRNEFCIPKGSDLALDPFQSQQNTMRALYASKLAEMAYDLDQKQESLNNKTNSFCHPLTIKKQFRDPEGPAFVLLQEDSQQARDEQIGILSFKGTTTPQEWTGINFRGADAGCKMLEAEPATVRNNKKSTECGLVHFGFQNAFITKLLPHIKESVKEFKKLIIIGHSLGGSMAILASFWLAKHMPEVNIESVYLFGSPRVGDKKFVQEYGKYVPVEKVHRVVSVESQLWSKRDPVTLVPPKENFKHVVDHASAVKCVSTTHPGGNCTALELHCIKHYSQSIASKLEQGNGTGNMCLSW